MGQSLSVNRALFTDRYWIETADLCTLLLLASWDDRIHFSSIISRPFDRYAFLHLVLANVCMIVVMVLHESFPAAAFSFSWGPLILAATIVAYLGVSTVLKHYPLTKR